MNEKDMNRPGPHEAERANRNGRLTSPAGRHT